MEGGAPHFIIYVQEEARFNENVEASFKQNMILNLPEICVPADQGLY